MFDGITSIVAHQFQKCVSSVRFYDVLRIGRSRSRIAECMPLCCFQHGKHQKQNNVQQYSIIMAHPIPKMCWQCRYLQCFLDRLKSADSKWNQLLSMWSPPRNQASTGSWLENARYWLDPGDQLELTGIR